ncbi:Na(+)-translocating NADH-quinone reductase subunit A [Amaricoccus macauensis]|uniref:Na(+)-translocating NADH-quinone reductase subunit A n=1 Tax=Amaricoccus macauensis TaxID=57001 RepID=UPI003C7A079F
MSEHVLKRGLDLPMSGAPEQVVDAGRAPASVAVVGDDYLGLKPKMLVAEGDTVRRGDPLFCHKTSPDVFYVAPASGRVRAINRGARRVLQSVVIDVDDALDHGQDFGPVALEALPEAPREDIQSKLYASGLWTAFRTRPYSKVPAQDDVPAAIFVTAMDTEPHAPDPVPIIEAETDAFEAGLTALTRLTDGKIYVCKESGRTLPHAGVHGVEIHEFSGPHPAGLPGTHIHFLEPPTAEKFVWHIGYQDVIAIGKLFLTGHIHPSRIISIAGPRALNPRLVRTYTGAYIPDLVADEYSDHEPIRVISGSVLSGRSAEGPYAYLGRYARQVTLITENHDQEVLGWISPQREKYAVHPVLASGRKRGMLFNLTTNLNGGRRAMVPTGIFEELMPQDYLPTQLLRALLVMDTDTAQALGALELDEEDLALCTFACPAKYEYGLALRASLEKIEKEG